MTKARRISTVVAVLGAALLAVGAVTSSNPASAAVEADAPVLEAIGRTSAATLTPPAEATLEFIADDEGSGIWGVAALYLAPNGGTLYGQTGGKTSGTLTFPIATTAVSGKYTLLGVTVIDKASTQNSVTYLRDGTIRKDTQGTTGPATHGFDFALADFAVDNDGGDATNPVLTSVTRTSPSTVEAPGNITLNYAASDAGTKVTLVGAIYRAPNNATLISNLATTGTGTLTIPVTAEHPSGKYELLTVRVVDDAWPKNDVFYNRDGTITKNTPSSTGPTTHSVDFAAADVIVDNDGGDATNPVLGSISRTSAATIADPGPITLSFTSSDAGAGVLFTAAAYVGPGNVLYNSNFAAGTSGTLTIPLPANAPDGNYRLALVRVKDQAIPGNDVTYNRDGSISKLTAGAAGPTSHSLDFEAADVRVGTATTTSSSSTTSTTAGGSSSSSSSTSSSTSTTAAGSSTTAPGSSTSTTVAPGGGATGIQLSSTRVAPGSVLRVTSAGWQGTVQVLMRSDPVLIGALTAGANGVIDGNVTIPASATIGTHTLELMGTGADGKPRVASTTFTVATSATSQLPKTGASTVPIAWAGAVLLLAGIAGVGMGERPAPAGQRRRTRR